MSTALIIGSGRMARIRLRTLAADPGIDRILIATRRPIDADDPIAGQGAVIGLDEIAGQQVDLAFIAGATSNHAADAGLALGLSCPVLCEKPIAADTSGAERVVGLLADERRLFVAFQRHFVPALVELHDRLAPGGSVGPIYHLRASHFDHTIGRPEFIATSGGIFKDLLVHDIECATWLTDGRVESVFAQASVRGWDSYAEYGDFDTATVLMTMADGLVVSLQGTRHHPLGQDVRVEAIGKGGAVAAGLTAATPIDAIERPDDFAVDPPKSFEDVFAAAFDAETAGFVDYALGRAETFAGATAVAALAALRVTDACERSVAVGAPVPVEGAR